MNEPKKYSRILLADDNSEHAQAAVQLLCDLPLDRKTPITVMRAFPSIEAAEAYALEEKLQKTCLALTSAGFTPEAELVLGAPAEKIIEFASTFQPQLIILGAKGLRSTFGILLGGVAQQVVEYACCPVLIVRAPYSGIKKVLFVTDGSQYSVYAATYLSNFPISSDTEISVMHVLPPLQQLPIEEKSKQVIVDQGFSKIIDEKFTQSRKDAEHNSEIILADASLLLSETGKRIKVVSRDGDAATEIIRYVKQENINLLVAGSRGLSQMQAWLLGSVSRKLVHYSDCSVLIVRKPTIR